ncbi:MAG TPA: alpha/beta hydrolase [Flavipsychrobacter sp.]|nr:alpha/beta hydrolase [Flavipsychrobacter sp.]
MKKVLLLVVCVMAFTVLKSQTLVYPHPVQFLPLTLEQQAVKMAYMDVPSAKPNGQAVVLLHGKNFNGYYWKDVIPFLTEAGYRVIVPDQVGWGQSDKPNIHYSFHLLASNTKKLLDTLGIQKAHVLGHSMGGMLATRFALMYPQTVDKLIYENPIGLEDYKTFVPYTPADEQYANEMKANYESLKKYQQSYYPVWKPEYEQYVAAQFAALQLPDRKQATWASALTYLMIYEQPVVYEFKHINQPTLLIIGQEDRTVVGKNLLPKEVAARHGRYPQLGKWLKSQIRDSQLAELKGVGHIPHIQALPAFRNSVLAFLRS